MPVDLDIPTEDLGTAPVPTDDDKPTLDTETRADYTARQRESAPPRAVAKPAGMGALQRLEDRYRGRPTPGAPISPEELAAAQERAKSLPSPDEAVKLREISARRGVPFGFVLTGGVEKQPFPKAWTDYGENTGLPSMLLDPTKSVFATPDDLEKFSRTAGVQKNPFPTTRAGLGAEAGQNQIRQGHLWFNVMMNGGVPSAADAAELNELETRASVLPNPDGIKGQIIEGALQQVPRFLRMMGVGALAALPGLALGPAAPGAASAFAGAAITADNAMEYIGSTYKRMRQEWGFPHDVAMPLSLIEGVVEAGLDTASFGILTKFPALNVFKNLPVVKGLAFRSALKMAAKDARFVTLLKEMAKDGFTELSTESAQQAAQLLTGYIGGKIDPGEHNLPTAAQAADEVLVSGLVGGVIGTGFGGVGTLARETITNVHVAEGTKNAIDKLYDVTDGLAVSEKAPSVTKEVVDKQAEHGAVKTVSVPMQSLEPLLTLNQETPVVKEFLARPDIARALALARETGGRVKLSLGDFVAFIRPLDKSGKLKTEIGLNDEMSVGEAKELAPAIQRAKKEMQDIAKRREALENLPESAIIRDIEEKLTKAGATAESARIQAEIVASGLSALSKRVGKDAWTTYRSAPITINSLTHEQFDTKSLEQADPKAVTAKTNPILGTEYMQFSDPESGLFLATSEDEFHGRKVRIGNMLGFHETGSIVPDTEERIAKEGGKGYSTALYIAAIRDAMEQGLGWVSDTNRSDKTEEMYARLNRLGFSFELVKTNPESKLSSDRYAMSNERLREVDFDAAWQKLVDGAKRNDQGQFRTVTEMEIDAVLNHLVELKQGQKGVVRGRITFNPTLRNWFAITLTGKANLSTFLHEASHYLLEIMRKLALENPGSALDADLKVLEEWAGAKDGVWSDEALEKFARGMETYFGEGKPPSEKLRTAFATVKQWILKVYKKLVNLNAPLTDEVRTVMDRMLATEEELGARRLELGYFPQKLSEDMDPAAQLAYREMYERGAEQAQAKLDREAVEGLKKETTEQYKKITAEVEQELNTHPAIALRAWFDTGNRTDGGLVLPPEFAGKKLDREAVVAMKLGPGILPKLSPYLTDGKLEQGVDPGELAPYFRYKNGPEMVLSLAETPSRETLKKSMVKERMTALHPEYGGDPAWIEQKALDKLHGEDAIANAIELEIALAYKKLSQTPPKSLAAVAKMAAGQAVQEMTRKEQDPATWRDAERRSLKEQMEAWAAKDFQTAAEAGRKRLYARAMWDATTKAARQMDAAEKYVMRFGNPNTLARLGRSSTIEVSGETLGAIFRDTAAAIAESTGLVARSAASETTIDEHVQKLENLGLPVAVDPALREKTPTPWNDRSYADAMTVQEALKNISHLASEANTIRIAEEKADLDALADSIEKNLAGKKLLGRLGDREGQKHDRLRALRAQIAKPETIAEDIGETFHRVWMQTAEQGQFERDRRFREHRAGLRELSKTYRPEGWSKLMSTKHVFEADGHTYTGSEVFAMLLNLGTESNRRKLILGMQRAGRNWTLDNVTAFVHKVFPDRSTYLYAQAVLDYISQANLWEDSAKVSEALSGTRPRKVEATAIPLPDGTEIAGGYYPIVYDNKVPTTDLDTRRSDGLDAMEAAVLSKLYASHGFTESRTSFVAPILLDPRALAAHIYEVDHYISNAPGILARHKLLSQPRVKAAIVNSLGYDYWDQMRLSNNYIARDGKVLTAELLQMSSIADRLIYHNALLVMGGNVLSGLNQIVNGVPATLARLGIRGLPAFGKALVDFVRSPMQTWEEVSKLSGEIEGMEFHYDRDLRLIVARELNGTNWETIKSRIAATTMTPVVFGQKLVNVLTWKAAYSIALADGKVGEDAVLYANSAVRQSQSSSGPKDMTAVQRSKDGLMRVLTSLASYTFTLNDLVMPRRMTKEQLAGTTSRLVMLMLTSMMAKALMDALFPKLAEKDDERKKGLEKMAAESDIPGLEYAVESMSDVLYNVPVVGRLGQALISGREPRFASWVDTGIKALEAAPDAFSDKGLSKSELRAVVESIGLATGIPTRHLVFAPGEFMSEYLDGNIDDAPWAFFQELTLARPGQKGNR